jgi:hypothetical protein
MKVQALEQRLPLTKKNGADAIVARCRSKASSKDAANHRVSVLGQLAPCDSDESEDAGAE